MVYCNKEYCFSEEELEDIKICLKEYKTLIELSLKNKKKPLGKTLKKLYQERLDFFEFLFLNLDDIKNNVEFKKEIS